MSESLTSKTVEFSSGQTGALPLHQESSNSYLYPLVQLVPTELGGLSVKHFVAAASNNATALKTSAGQLYGFYAFSIDAADLMLVFYDTDSSPTPGTTTIKCKFGIRKAATSGDGADTSLFLPMGIPFSTGIAYALLEPSDLADSDTTAVVGADACHVEIFYK